MELEIMLEGYDDIRTVMIDKISNPALRDFVKASLNKYGTDAKYKTAIKVADLLMQQFEYLGFVNPYSKNDFVDYTLAAALLHNLFYDEKDIRTLFNYRINLKPIAEQVGLDEREFRVVIAYIESSPGRLHEIIQLAPPKDTPAETLSICIWYVTKYKPIVSD